MSPVPTDYPERSPHSWEKTHDGDDAKVWRNGTGDMVSFYRTSNENNDRWAFADSTDQASEGSETGPFETYVDALDYVNKFIPELGIEDLPDREVPPDAIVEIGSYPNKATDRECEECEETVFTSFRIEYGDGSHEWYCVKCAAERFDWDLDKETTATIDFGSDEMYDGMEFGRESLFKHADALVGAGVLDENTLTMLLHSLHKQHNLNRDDPDEPPVAHRLHMEILEVVKEYRETHPDISWSDIRDVLNETRRYAHEYAREEIGESKGRRELLNEIQESDLSPNEWFEEHAGG